MDYFNPPSLNEYKKFNEKKKKKWIKIIIAYVIFGLPISFLLILITLNNPENPAALGLMPLWLLFIVLLYFPMKYGNVLNLIEHFEKINLINARCYPDAIVFKKGDIYFLGLPGRLAIYLVKMLEKMPASKRKIALPWNYYFSKPIKFGSGNIFFKKSRVVIKDENGEYLEGEACVLMLPFEYVKRFLFFYSTISGRKYSAEEIEEAVKILEEKCKEAVGIL